MEQRKTRLVEEDNTIYEIDLDCMRRKELRRRRETEGKNTGGQGRGEYGRKKRGCSIFRG